MTDDPNAETARKARPDSRGPDAIGHADATDVLSYLLAGPITFGALGWLGDRLLHTAFLLPLGALLGVVLGLYIVWLRYGRDG